MDETIFLEKKTIKSIGLGKKNPNIIYNLASSNSSLLKVGQNLTFFNIDEAL